MTIELDTSLFPAHESPYSYPELDFVKELPFSIVALNLDIAAADGNLLEKGKKNQFLFRDFQIPTPRPCTQLAWERICRLGHDKSQSFLVPFLPALREEDEVGSAIGERGSHVPSLSRRSGDHHRETKDDGKYIIWGAVFIATLTTPMGRDYHLTGAIQRSNITESLITPPTDMWSETAQDSIRLRMEFLASWGIPCMYDIASVFGLPRIRRLMFQMLSQEAASRWAKEYVKNHFLIRRDRSMIDSDYQELIQEIKERKFTPKQDKAEKSSKGNRFSDFLDEAEGL